MNHPQRRKKHTNNSISSGNNIPWATTKIFTSVYCQHLDVTGPGFTELNKPKKEVIPTILKIIKNTD
jgi:protein-disulfide isomerase